MLIRCGSLKPLVPLREARFAAERCAVFILCPAVANDVLKRHLRANTRGLMKNKYLVLIAGATFCVALGVLAVSGPHGSAGRLLAVGIPMFTATALVVSRNRRRL